MYEDLYGGVVHFTKEDYESVANALKGNETPAERVQMILRTRAEEVYRRIVDCADMCINLDIPTAPLCEIGDNVLDFQLDKYEEPLVEAEQFFIHIEDYEMCSRIVDVRNRIETLEDIQ